jgi:hypothetical protein
VNSGVIVCNSDLFSEPTDIVVLPCARSGTITDRIRSQITKCNIPAPRRTKPLGEIEVIRLASNNTFARYVCWAATVSATYGTVAALRKIMKEVAQFAESQPNIRTVSSPLLGTEHGDVDKLKSAAALAEGFLSAEIKDIVLHLHVLDAALADEIGRTFASSLALAIPAVREVSELDGPQLKRCHEALMSAFDQAGLERMVKFEMNEDLDAIAGGDTLTARIFELLEWAQRHGRLTELLQGAINTVPGNPKLKPFIASLLSAVRPGSPCCHVTRPDWRIYQLAIPYYSSGQHAFILA